MNTCPEPDGNEFANGTFQTQHEIMLKLTGQCPWCGETR